MGGAAAMDGRVTVEVDGRRLTLSNLGKVLYPQAHVTKAEVIDYYTRISPVLLPHVAGRPMTFTRWPDGVEGTSFFEKNVPSHAPPWVHRVTLPAPGSGRERAAIDYVLVDDLPTLVWAANLASLELHVPQWRVGADGGPLDPDLLVLDLDPGPPADVVTCCAVALALRAELAAAGLPVWVKTSGSKGLQLSVPLHPTPADRTSGFARDLAERLARAHPDLVVSRMDKALRRGRVLIDWSQNNAAKTTVAPYSLRAREAPTVSTPVTWAEVEACRTATDLRFTAPDVLDRVAHDGDLLAGLLDPVHRGLLPGGP